MEFFSILYEWKNIMWPASMKILLKSIPKTWNITPAEQDDWKRNSKWSHLMSNIWLPEIGQYGVMEWLPEMHFWWCHYDIMAWLNYLKRNFLSCGTDTVENWGNRQKGVAMREYWNSNSTLLLRTYAYLIPCILSSSLKNFTVLYPLI